MKKDKEAGEPGSEEQETPVSMKEVSRDINNGIVVFKTDAEEGTGFTLKVDDDTIHATAVAGQVWFYAGYNLGETPNIRLA